MAIPVPIPMPSVIGQNLLRNRITDKAPPAKTPDPTLMIASATHLSKAVGICLSHETLFSQDIFPNEEYSLLSGTSKKVKTPTPNKDDET